jgi:superfamily II DNA/RNA helicase
VQCKNWLGQDSLVSRSIAREALQGELGSLRWLGFLRLTIGCLVITPTRELAIQIFNTLRQVGKFHSFSAGLLIGGKDLEEGIRI